MKLLSEFLLVYKLVGAKTTLDCAPFDEAGPKDRGVLKCKPGQEINVQSAIYGRKSETECSAGNGKYEAWRYEVCANTEDVTEVVRAECDGKNSCTFRSYHRGFDDPCVGTHKYNKIKYTCEEPRCSFSDNFVRHCDDALAVIHEVSAQGCLDACNANPKCTKGHHHPGNQIWEEDDREVCWLWEESDKPCPWSGGELIAHHPGATMVRCNTNPDRPKSCEDLKPQNGQTGGDFTIYPYGNDKDYLKVYCDFESEPAETYLNVNPDNNFSLFVEDRLGDNHGHECSEPSRFNTQDDWDKSGRTEFTKIKLNISTEGVSIERTGTKFTTHDGLHSGGSDQPKAFGTAGDCFSWNECEKVRKGNFNIDLADKADIDWSRTGDWKANAWGNGNFIVDFAKTVTSVSARCGGWCGDCEPSTEIFLLPAGSAPPIEPERGFDVSRNNLYSEIDTLYKQWSVSVDIKPTGTVTGWSNILHVGIGGDHAVYGDRTPGIWFHSDTTKMHVSSAINGNSNSIMNTDALAIGEWSTVEISQFVNADRNYDFTLSINGDEIGKVTNTDAQNFKDVKVFTSDDFYAASKARIDNLRISTFPDGTTEKFTTDIHYNYAERGPVLTNKRAISRGVHFSVKAENDIHISLSENDPITTDSWEIVLGGWSGSKSVIRSSHQGDHLVEVTHSKEQFLKWQENFSLKMDDSSVGLYAADGSVIIKYDQFDSSNVKYMYVSTGFGLTGSWIVNKRQDGFNYERHPEDALIRIQERFVKFLSENFASHANFVAAVTKKVDGLKKRMVSKWERINDKCELWEVPEDMKHEGVRYDQENPCNAAQQLPNVFMKWSNVYNVNCKNSDSDTAFPDRVQGDFDKITKKLQKKLKTC